MEHEWTGLARANVVNSFIRHLYASSPHTDVARRIHHCIIRVYHPNVELTVLSLHAQYFGTLVDVESTHGIWLDLIFVNDHRLILIERFLILQRADVSDRTISLYVK